MNIVSPPGSKLLNVSLENAVGPCDLASPETTPATAAAGAVARRLPVGAELTPRGVSFRVWAPERRQVTVVLAESLEALASFPLQPEATAIFRG